MAIGYWLDLFTYETWTEFFKAGGDVSGFSDNRWKSVQSMKSGDILLCYLTGVSRWIGVLGGDGSSIPGSDPYLVAWRVSCSGARKSSFQA